MRIDGHVHFVGDGSNGSGCWLRSSTLLDRIVEPIVKAQAGISKASRQFGIDQAFEQRLIGLIDGSALDAVLLLAMICKELKFLKRGADSRRFVFSQLIRLCHGDV